MSPEPSVPSRYLAAPSWRVRAAALVIALTIVALIVVTMIKLGIVDRLGGPRAPHLVTVAEIDQNSGGGSQRLKPPARTAVRRVAPPRLPQITPHPTPSAPSFIHLSKEEFAAADIGKMAKPEGDADQGASTYGPDEGPDGVRLYRAEWYHRPSDAEIDGYIKNAAPSGAWAEIACRTAEHFHVEDCQELEESPPGSGLSRSLRQAAWQFLIRPPRINGAPQIGVWVKIHFDFIVRNAPDVVLPQRE